MSNEESILQMMTSKEVKEAFGITTMTLHRWRKKGLVKFVEYPKTKFRYPRAEIEKILREGF